MDRVEHLGFMLPHWAFWGLLIIFPAVALAALRWRRVRAARAVERRRGRVISAADVERDVLGADWTPPGNAVSRAIDRVSLGIGELASFWVVLAVLFHAFEVTTRYVLRTPVPWPHEASSLVFGLLFVLSGAAVCLSGDHVRMDALHARWSPRWRAASDLATSAFLFIFAGALALSGWVFFTRAIDRGTLHFGRGGETERSMGEWAIALWPFKLAIAVAGVLILLQGVSRLIKDFQVFRHYEEPGRRGLGLAVAVVFGALALFAGIELMNVLFVDPYAEGSFFFTLQGTLRGIPVATLALLMTGALAILLAAGLPIAFAAGGLAVVFMYLVGDKYDLNVLPPRVFAVMTDYQLSAIPLFVFMAAMLERTGFIDEVFDVACRWMSGIRGGLASATIVASTILAAVVGIIGTTVVTLGLIALPAMLRRRYDTKLALGAVMAGGTLGIMIPPSVLAIVYAVVARESVGGLYVGSVLPGVTLAGLYVLYVAARSLADPRLAPPLPPEERVGTKDKIRLLKEMVAPIILIFLVLGLILTGTADAVESAGIGSFGALVVAVVRGRLTLTAVKEACAIAMRHSATVLWIMFGATLFADFLMLQGARDMLTRAVMESGLGSYAILALMMVFLIALGMFLDWVGILVIAVPLLVPVATSLPFEGVLGFPGVEPHDVALWFGVIFIVNMQMSFLSPPFGYALFHIREAAPPSIATGTIQAAALPFLGLQLVALSLCILFPEIILLLTRWS